MSDVIFLLDKKLYNKYKFLIEKSNVSFIDNILTKQLLYSKKYFGISYKELQCILNYLNEEIEKEKMNSKTDNNDHLDEKNDHLDEKKMTI